MGNNGCEHRASGDGVVAARNEKRVLGENDLNIELEYFDVGGKRGVQTRGSEINESLGFIANFDRKCKRADLGSLSSVRSHAYEI